MPAERLPEVFHLYDECGAPLRPEVVPLVRAAHGEHVQDALVSVRAPGQPVLHLRVNAAPLSSRDGVPQGAWSVITDVTTLVAASQGQRARCLAEIVNHHLRTPLASLLGHAELLEDQDLQLPPEAVYSLAAVTRAGERLHDAVQWISELVDQELGPGG